MQKGIAENKECVYHINVYMYGRDITHVHGCNMVQVAVYPVLQACKFKKKYIIKAQQSAFTSYTNLSSAILAEIHHFLANYR